MTHHMIDGVQVPFTEAEDWAALPDSPTMSSAMTTYRAALRDYPATYTADNSAAFPTLGE